MEGGAVGHNFEMGLPKDYPSLPIMQIRHILIKDHI
jgi:hypothetical protein